MTEHAIVINRKQNAVERIVTRALATNLRYKTTAPIKTTDEEIIPENTELVFVLNFGHTSVYLLNNDEESFVSIPNNEENLVPVQPKLTLSLGVKLIQETV